MPSSHLLGVLAGLGASLTWAIGSLIFSRLPLPAAALNFLKCSLATLFLGVTVAIVALVRGEGFAVSAEAWGYLGASAVVGIALGDTAYYRSLQILGPRRALVVTTLTPLVGAGLGWILLGERLCWHGWLGVATTVSGVAWVLLERRSAAEAPGLYPGRLAAGVLFGFLGALCQAGGVVLSKQALQTLPPLETAFLRLGIAAVLTGMVALRGRRLGVWLAAVRSARLLPGLAAGTFCGTFVGIWLSLVATANASVAVATTLTSLAPIFILPLAWVCHGHRLTLRGAAGAAVTVAGVALLFCSCPAR